MTTAETLHVVHELNQQAGHGFKLYYLAIFSYNSKVIILNRIRSAYLSIRFAVKPNSKCIPELLNYI